MMKHKMYVIFAKESIDKMKGNRGKMCAQAGHAYLHTFIHATTVTPKLATAYLENKHAYKIALVVDTVEQLQELQAAYKDVCATKLITDAGFTVFSEPTTTCLGLGPISEDLIGADLQSIKVFC
jgi:peptidyl-tRNA hydrolase